MTASFSAVGAERTRRHGAEHVNGYVVPGMPNAHSHAFQRGMVGDTEYRLSARDSFWTWRQAMYALANRITAADLEVLATQLFIEMLKSGYTSVAEFHYLHREPDGAPAAGSNALWDAVRSRRRGRGHRIHVPADALSDQRFRVETPSARPGALPARHRSFLRAIEERVSAERRLGLPCAHRRGLS